MMVRRELSLRCARVSILEQGRPDPAQPSLLLVHGLMGTAETFAPLLASLPAGRHAVAVDLPGAGLSARGRDLSANLEANSGCVGEVIRALQMDRPVLVGHSHGGAVALHLAASERGLVRSLVLLAPAHPYFRQADAVIAFYLSVKGRTFARAMPWLPRRMQLQGLGEMMGDPRRATPERLAPYRSNLRTPGTVAHLLRLLKTWHSDQQELDRLLGRPLGVPTLLIWGNQDRVVPLSSAAGLQRRLGGCELAVLAGAGHLPAEEQPEACAQLMDDWCLRLSVEASKAGFSEVE